MDKLGVTPVSQELSCSEDLRTERAPGIFPSVPLLWLTLVRLLASCRYLVESKICGKLGTGKRCASILGNDHISLPVPSL